MPLSQSLEAAESIAKSYRDMASRVNTKAVSPSAVIGSRSGSSSLASMVGGEEQKTADQYEQFWGWQYAAISAITKRAAAQRWGGVED